MRRLLLALCIGLACGSCRSGSSGEPYELSNAEWEQRLRESPALRTCRDDIHEVWLGAGLNVPFSESPCTDGDDLQVGPTLKLETAQAYRFDRDVVTLLSFAPGAGDEHGPEVPVRFVHRQWPDGRNGIVGSIRDMGLRPIVRPGDGEIEVDLLAFLYLGSGDGGTLMTNVVSTFRGGLSGMRLVRRRLQAETDDPSSIPTTWGSTQRTINDLMAIALDGGLTDQSRTLAVKALQTKLGESAFASALQSVPFFDAELSGFRRLGELVGKPSDFARADTDPIARALKPYL